jgi:hypothetical protein
MLAFAGNQQERPQKHGQRYLHIPHIAWFF